MEPLNSSRTALIPVLGTNYFELEIICPPKQEYGFERVKVGASENIAATSTVAFVKMCYPHPYRIIAPGASGYV